MKQTKAQLEDIKLVGITCRTNNEHAFKADPSTNKIAATVQKYFHNGMADKIQNRKQAGTTYCVYTDYETDHTGDYTYFVGEEVASFDNIPEGFEAITIPAQQYIKYTNDPAGPMPNVCVDMWKDILAKSPSGLGAERAYLSDFEIYDERSADHSNVILDIYIGVKN